MKPFHNLDLLSTIASPLAAPKKKKDFFEFDWNGKSYHAKYDLLKEFYVRESDTHVRCRIEGCGKHSFYQHKPNCGYSNVFGHLNSKHKDWKEKLITEHPDQCYEIVKVASDVNNRPNHMKFTEARFTLEDMSYSEEEEVQRKTRKTKASTSSVLGKRRNAKTTSSSNNTIPDATTFALPDQFAEFGKDPSHPVGKMMDLFLQHQQVQQDYHNQLLQLRYGQEQWRRDQELKERQLQEKRDTESSSIMVQMMTLFLQSQPATTTATSATTESATTVPNSEEQLRK